MSDTYLTLLAAVIARLKADGTITGKVSDRIYSDVVDNPTFPFIRVEIQSQDYSVKDTAGMEHTIQFSVFSRKVSPDEAGQIRARIYDLFNRQENALSAIPISNILFNGVSLIFKEADGKTWNSIVQFRAVAL